MNGTVVRFERRRALREQAVSQFLSDSARWNRWRRIKRTALRVIVNLALAAAIAALGAAVGIAWQAWVQP